MINTNRLAKRFKMFAEIDSISKKEGALAKVLADILKNIGAKVKFDKAHKIIGGNCGNLVAKFKGNTGDKPIFFSGHMDTVKPGKGVKVIFDNGVFKSNGTTILGADDKSALAIIIEVMEVIFENNLDYPPIEIIFTICEEIGLLGAKHFDFSLIDSKMGYILDSTDINGIITKAPASNRFTIKIHGKDAHAGISPENGINAILVAAKAIASLNLGRIDHETTCNLGIIKGGIATNIVPELVIIEGEARSHNKDKLKKITNTIINAFHKTIDSFQKKNDNLPKIEVILEQEFSATNISDNHSIIKLVKKACENLGRQMESKSIEGGSDANIFFTKKIIAGVLGTGMTDVHTLRESIKLDDMEKTAKLLLEIIKTYIAGDF
ncbi:MAG: peptidase T [Desulfobacteraceae bacterium 4572_130]|nr:MAG: peptidase T [Desulfobacteraceae bacterium 4572_130]